MKERIKHLILLIFLIGIDQVLKYWVRTDLINRDSIDIIDGVLSLQYHSNTGAVWGILSGKVDFLKIFTLIILILIIFLYFKIPVGKRYNPLKILTVFMIAGAIGNLIDRFFLSYVVDFIYFEIIDFPLFNFADSCLTVAAIVLFLLALFYYKDEDFAFLNEMFKKKSAQSNSGEEDRTEEDSEEAKTTNEADTTKDAKIIKDAETIKDAEGISGKDL